MTRDDGDVGDLSPKQPFQLCLDLTSYYLHTNCPRRPHLREKLFAAAEIQIEHLMSGKENHRNRRVLFGALCFSLVIAGSQPAPRASNVGEDILSYLNKTVAWYHQATAQQRLVRGPADAEFFSDSRRAADQIVRLSFDFARERGRGIAVQPLPAQNEAALSAQYQKLSEAARNVDQQVQQTQQEIDGLQKQLASAAGKKRSTLQATIAETQGELELFQARRDALRSMLQVGGPQSGEAVSLTAQIEELAQTIPAGAESKEQPATSASSPAPSTVTLPSERKSSSGILALISDLIAERRRLQALDSNLAATDVLSQAARSLGEPLGGRLRELARQGDALAVQADTSGPATLAQQRRDLDSLTAQYKQVSATLLPLGRQSILFDIYRRDIANWRIAVKAEYESQIKGLMLRLAGLGAILALIFAISELWRRATFRYITDSHRRYQFLALRRFVVWSLMAIVIAIAFASELGAITTFAGFLTAGIAVALQNVILSIAGYFFLIGKHGVRVGDRVQVAGITGDVVDIGLVRLHLMEVTGGSSARPTGRVVSFSNAVVFQANAGMFKQIPGTSFLWHEVTLSLGAESNYLEAEKRALEAVNRVFAEYHDKMEMQRRGMERSLYTVRLSPFAPESRLRLTPTGVEIVIRYPVELENAAEIDDRVTRELLETIGRDPHLRLVGTQIEEQSA